MIIINIIHGHKTTLNRVYMTGGNYMNCNESNDKINEEVRNEDRSLSASQDNCAENGTCSSWAENEVRVACEYERGDRPEDEFDYGCECYKSALRAYNTLMGDGHTGLSIALTRNILNRLLQGKVLTPIYDTDDVWEVVRETDDEGHDLTVYQCKRMSSLFKYVENGKIVYHDIDMFEEYVINDDDYLINGPAIRLIKDRFPITMPYMPKNKPYTVNVYEYLSDPKNGDFDTIGIVDVTTPDGDKIPINEYYKEREVNSEWEIPWAKIDEDEYNERVAAHYERQA